MIRSGSAMDFNQFTYSKRSHFNMFRLYGLDKKLFGINGDPDKCDLKFYQDLLSFHILRQSLNGEMKMLEIGGGDSRILDHFSSTSECWNLDKLEGLGNGPTELSGKNYRIVLDYIGSHNPDLPENHFDIVFSISALEHVPLGDPEVYRAILTDINRVLKPGGLSFHCIDHTTDLLLGQVEEVWTNPLIEYLFTSQKTLNEFIPLVSAEEDPDLFAVSREYFTEHWQPVVGKTYEEFGRPFSYNVFWRK
jgi:ubiquinone/menaquinone biosynthesis C-methylase UbiE